MARTNVLKKLGKRVKELRVDAGLTQEQLGEKTGLDRTYISGIERGARNPSVLSVAKIAKALAVKVNNLVDF